MYPIHYALVEPSQEVNSEKAVRPANPVEPVASSEGKGRGNDTLEEDNMCNQQRNQIVGHARSDVFLNHYA